MYEPLPPVVEWLKNLRISDLDEIVTDDREIYELAGQYAAEAVKENCAFMKMNYCRFTSCIHWKRFFRGH